MAFKELFRAENSKEELSYKIIFLSALMIFVGLLLGSFIKYTVLLAMGGSFLLLVGLILYIISRLM